MKSLVSASLGLAWLAASAAAHDIVPVTPERIAEFVDVLAKQDCKLRNDQARSFMPTVGFEDDIEVRQIVGRLMYEGRARFAGAGSQPEELHVFGGPCPDRTGPALTDVFYDLLAEQGCAMSARGANKVLRAKGIFKQEVRAAVKLMQHYDAITISGDDTMLRLNTEMCKSRATFHAAAFKLPAVEDPQKRAGFVTLAAANGCRLHLDEAEADLKAIGLGRSDAREIGKAMVEAGEASVEGPVLVLDNALCAAAGDSGTARAAVATQQAAALSGQNVEAAIAALKVLPRATLGEHVREIIVAQGCTLDISDPAAMETLVMDRVADRLAIAPAIRAELHQPLYDAINDGVALLLKNGSFAVNNTAGTVTVKGCEG